MKAQKALDLLLPIPTEDFITTMFNDYSSKCCAIGHLVRLTTGDPTDYERDLWDSVDSEAFNLRESSTRFMQGVGGIARVNNINTVEPYTEDTSKARVVHLLEDMIKAGY
jgi:hypothetical protein